MRRGVRYVIQDGKLIESWKARPKVARNYFGQAPAVFCDTISPRYSDATGRTYESRSQMRDEIKASGALEVGWDYQAPEPKDISEEEVIQDIQQSYHELKNGDYRYLNEEDLSVCKELNGRLRKP